MLLAAAPVTNLNTSSPGATGVDSGRSGAVCSTPVSLFGAVQGAMHVLCSPRLYSFTTLVLVCHLILSLLFLVLYHFLVSPHHHYHNLYPKVLCVCVFSFPLIVLFLHFSANALPNAVVQPTCPSPPSFKHTHTYTHTLFHKSDNFYFCFCFLLHLSTCFRPETRGPTCSKPNQSINMIIWPFSHSFSHRNISFFCFTSFQCL